MILQALKEYYDRKASDADSDIAPPGWEWKEIAYVLVLDKDGNPIDLVSTVEGTGKSKTTKRFLIPQSIKRTVGIAANLLWDTPEYVLGVPLKGSPERVAQQHEAFVTQVHALGEVNDPGFKALKQFFAIPDKEKILEQFAEWENLKKTGSFFVFKLAGARGIITDSSAVKKAIDAKPSLEKKESESKSTGKRATKVAKKTDAADSRITCLITGEKDELENLHASIKGVWGGNTSGGTIIGFNLDAFCSFGKKQGENSPVGKKAAFAFATALNTMLAKGSKNRMQVGDASTVAWASEENEFEGWFITAFSEPPKDNPDEGVEAVRAIYKSIESGAFHVDAKDKEPPRFYVLGLAPNAARISIRFWIVDTVENIAKRIKEHFDDLQIDAPPKAPEFLPLFRLLVATAVQGKSDNIPPNLAGETMRAILQGLPYPATLLKAAIRRICAEREVSYPRAATIKAYLNRFHRFYKKETNFRRLTVSLDKTNDNKGYLLGRLFAVLEKIQSEANPGINATIRDRFYAAASGTPASVFSNLMRLKNHHLSKLENAGRRVNLERILGEIIDGIEKEFPSHLSLHDQGCFAIGYYHQMQDFYKKKETVTTEAE